MFSVKDGKNRFCITLYIFIYIFIVQLINIIGSELNDDLAIGSVYRKRPQAGQPSSPGSTIVQ